MGLQNLVFRQIKAGDEAEAVRVYADGMAPSGPWSAQLSSEQMVEWTMKRKRAYLTSDTSFVCEDQSLPVGQRIVGIRLSAPFVIREYDTTLIDALAKHNVEKFLDHHPELRKDSVKGIKVLHLGGLAVKPSHRQLGIAKALTNMCIEEAKRLGYELVYTTATSEVTQHMYGHSLGFTPLTEVDFNTFEFNGEKPFATVKNAGKEFVFEKRIQ